ncbi:MAG: 2Fe-2S iron-sulfur cluster binding domain-containing protein [Lewinellaceae bacterium]|nr:2Fe-2S iron-sulfur cluster binding domain-containing protein [Lewinellaceae bacterium]
MTEDCDCQREQEIICVTVIDREGDVHCLEAPTDMSMNMMEVSKSHGLPVEGICGGMALCASCHMYVESDHILDEPSEDEENMLDQAFFVKPNSRLGCQIKITHEIDGLIVRLAPVAPEE